MGQTVIAPPVVQTGQYYPYDPVKNPLGQKTWTQYFKNSSPSGSSMSGAPNSRIIYGNGIYAFIISTGYVFYSTDAKNWNQQYIGANACYCIAYGNNIWVVAGYAGVLYSGTPGGTWTARTSQFGAGSYIYDVKWIPTVNLFISTGYPTSSGACAIASSADGITWTNRFNDTNSQGNYYAIDYDPSTTTIALSCGSSTNNIYYSTNGTSWTAGSTYGVSGQTLVFVRGALNKFVNGTSSLFTSNSANIGSTWASQNPTIQFNTPNNNNSFYGGLSTTPNHNYEMQYDSVNNYYYQYVSQSFYSNDLQNGTMELITYDASTLLNTAYNSTTNYLQAFPIVKTEVVPLSSSVYGVGRVAANYAYGYVNGIHIIAGYQMGTDSSFQIYTTA